MATLRQSPPEALLDAPSKDRVYIIDDSDTECDTEYDTERNIEDTSVNMDGSKRKQDDTPPGVLGYYPVPGFFVLLEYLSHLWVTQGCLSMVKRGSRLQGSVYCRRRVETISRRASLPSRALGADSKKRRPHRPDHNGVSWLL